MSISTKTKKIVFWFCLGILFLVGPGLNLMIEKGVPFNFVLDRMFKAPLPVHAYLLLLAVLSFVVGEILLHSLQEKNIQYPLLMCAILGVCFALTKYWYFSLLMAFGLLFTLVIVLSLRHQKDAIMEVLETVLETPIEIEEETEETLEAEEIKEEIEPSEDLSLVQQQEIDNFLDSLFEKTTHKEEIVEQIDEPLVAQILSDANEILDTAKEVEKQEEMIKKEPPKAVVLEKEKEEIPEDLLEANLKEKETLGEFDEEIPMDDFVE